MRFRKCLNVSRLHTDKIDDKSLCTDAIKKWQAKIQQSEHWRLTSWDILFSELWLIFQQIHHDLRYKKIYPFLKSCNRHFKWWYRVQTEYFQYFLETVRYMSSIWEERLRVIHQPQIMMVNRLKILSHTLRIRLPVYERSIKNLLFKYLGECVYR